MTRPFIGPISALNLINTALLVGGGAIAQALHSGHAFQRTGTMIAAVTGLFVVTQVLDEIRVERLLAQVDEDDIEKEADLPAVARLAVRIERKSDQREASTVRQARLILIVLIALWLSLGELVNGFGDIAFEAVNGGKGHLPPTAQQTARPAGQ